MSLVGFKAQNHPQQTRFRAAAKDEIDDRATPLDVFGPFHERFGFTVDVAAAGHNTKLERFYDLETSGLAQSWAGERVWCNPPYSNIRPWVEKAWQEWDQGHSWLDVPEGSLRTRGTPFRFCKGCDREEWQNGIVREGIAGCHNAQQIVMLLPANRTEQKWWQELVEIPLRAKRHDFHCEFLPGRIRFLRKGQSEIGPNERPPFGCCLLIWGAPSTDKEQQ